MSAAESLPLGAIAMGLFGGLALFLAGMEQMSQALREVAGEQLRVVMAKLTRNRFTAAATGAFVTAIIQSSSVTTVLVVGFISAGVMNLSQSVGIIMGANIGSTITAQIVAFKVTQYALLLVALGFGMNFMSKQEKIRQYGAMIMGLGLIFFGMGLMSDATNPLRSYEPFIELMQSMSRPLLGILVAAVFTALVQSSSATTGIVIVLASQGFVTLEAGIALAFGANIGTCVTALLAALGKPREAAQAATVHVLFNVIGVLIWLPFIPEFANIVREMSPVSTDLSGTAQLAADAPRQIANAHTAFNIGNTFLFIWFTAPLAALVQKLVPDRPPELPDRARPQYLDEAQLEVPSFALDRVRQELVRLGEAVEDMAGVAVKAMSSSGRDELGKVAAMRADATQLYGSIVAYMARLTAQNLSDEAAAQLRQLSAVSNILDSMGDTIATNLVALAERRLRGNISPSEQTREAFRPLRASVQTALRQAIEAVRDGDPESAANVIAMEAEIRRAARALEAHLAKRVAADEPNRVATYGLEIAAVEILQRLYQFSRRIAESVGADAADVAPQKA